MRENKLSQRDLYRLALEVGCCHQSVLRWLYGGSVSAGLRYALEQAAKRLEIKVVPQQGGKQDVS